MIYKTDMKGNTISFLNSAAINEKMPATALTSFQAGFLSHISADACIKFILFCFHLYVTKDSIQASQKLFFFKVLNCFMPSDRSE